MPGNRGLTNEKKTGVFCRRTPPPDFRYYGGDCGGLRFFDDKGRDQRGSDQIPAGQVSDEAGDRHHGGGVPRDAIRADGAGDVHTSEAGGKGRHPGPAERHSVCDGRDLAGGSSGLQQGRPYAVCCQHRSGLQIRGNEKHQEGPGSGIFGL